MPKDLLSVKDWDARFRQQAQWTVDLRRYLYETCRLTDARAVLEVGCGTGAITAELKRFRARIHGLDLDIERLRLAHKSDPNTAYLGGDALRLPFAARSFDIVLCHYLLLWLDDPAAALAEMKRVSAPGGKVLAMAEPDYGGRIDFPEALAPLGKLQAEALRDQGADVTTGRRLQALFSQAGFGDVHSGLLGYQWKYLSGEGFQSEWAVLENDLRGRLPDEELAVLRRLDQAAWQRGERVLFVPTFYAWGRV